MSADNGLIIKQTAEGWELREYCASTDEPWERMYKHGIYTSAEAALRASTTIYTEYGVSFTEDDAA